MADSVNLMARKRSRGRVRQEVLPQQKDTPKQKTRLRRILSFFLHPNGWFWAFVLLLLGLCGAYYQYKPKVSLQPGSPLKSDFILDTPFTLTNESVLPIYNIKQGEWLIERHRYSDFNNNSGIPFEVVSEFEPIQIPPEKGTINSLLSWQSVTLYPFDYMEDKTEKRIPHRITIFVDITYETAIFRRSRTQTFWFRGDMGADGIFHWYPTQESEVRKP